MLSVLGLVHQFSKPLQTDYGTFPLLSLPDDLLLHVSGFLDGRQLLVFHGVCRRFDQFCTENADRLRTFDNTMLQFFVGGNSGFFIQFGRNVVPTYPNIGRDAYYGAPTQKQPIKRQVGDAKGAKFWCKSDWRTNGYQYVDLNPEKKKTTWKQRRAAFKVIFRHYKPASFYTNMLPRDLAQWISLLPSYLTIFRYNNNVLLEQLELIDLFRVLSLLPAEIKTFGLYGFTIDLPRLLFSHPNLQRFEALEICELFYEADSKTQTNTFRRRVHVDDDQLVNGPWTRLYLGAYTPALTADAVNRMLQQWAEGERELIEFVFQLTTFPTRLDALLLNASVQPEKKQNNLAKLTNRQGKSIYVWYEEARSIFAFNQKVPGKFYGAITDFMFW